MACVSAGVSASLYATIGAEAHLQIEVQLILMSGLAMLWANAAASWNPRAGAGAVAYLVAGDAEIPLLSTNDADKEYSESDLAKVEQGRASGHVGLQYGAWMYIPMPRISFSAGIKAGNEFANVLECAGVDTVWKPFEVCVTCDGRMLAEFAKMDYLVSYDGDVQTETHDRDATPPRRPGRRRPPLRRRRRRRSDFDHSYASVRQRR